MTYVPPESDLLLTGQTPKSQPESGHKHQATSHRTAYGASHTERFQSSQLATFLVAWPSGMGRFRGIGGALDSTNSLWVKWD